jgi:hypothetical protein
MGRISPSLVKMLGRIVHPAFALGLTARSSISSFQPRLEAISHDRRTKLQSYARGESRTLPWNMKM